MKQRFGLVLVFMATRSGLTRWQDISLNPENETESGNLHFSNINNKAIDETWYKRAVEQYYVEPDSFVYSVPFDAGEKNDTLVTATHAVFHSDGSREAPAAVVGFQFHHSALFTLFKNITSSCTVKSCEKTCESDAYICYILDNNGYIIVSESRADTGKFFGEVKGYIMEKLVKEEIYKKITIYDYQAVCFSSEKGEPSKSCKINSAINYFGWMINWLLGKLVWILIQSNLQWLAVGAFQYTTGDATYPGYDDSNADIPAAKNDRPLSKIIINRTRPQPCDMKVNLYMLDIKRMKVIEKEIIENGCKRPYVVKDIPNSNLIMVVVDHFCESKYENTIIKILPTEVKYDEGHCCKIGRNLTRRNVAECANRSEKENDIKLCGHSVNLFPSYTLQVFSLVSFLQWMM